MNKIRKYRTDNGMKQTELCKLLGISQGALSSWETGRYEPDFKAAKKISEIFGVTIDELMGNDSTKKEPAADTNVDDKLTSDIIDMFQQLTESEKQLVLASVKGILSDRK